MRATPLLVAGLLALAPLALAEDCLPTTSTTGTTTRDGWTMIVVAGPAFGAYVVDDVCQPDCIFSIWEYFEANEIPGLQRNDDVHDDTCGGQIDSDSILF